MGFAGLGGVSRSWSTRLVLSATSLAPDSDKACCRDEAAPDDQHCTARIIPMLAIACCEALQ